MAKKQFVPTEERHIETTGIAMLLSPVVVLIIAIWYFVLKG